MSIIVTGASGSLGRQVTELLLEKVPPSEITLVTRKPASLSAVAARGVHVRAGNFDEPETLVKAFAGGEKMLLISTLDVGPRRQRQHRAAIEAAAAAGAKHIVYTSTAGIHPRNPALSAADHYATEEFLRRCGVAFTILRDSQYAEVIVTMLAPMAVRTGKWIMSTGDGCMAFVSKKDCAASAAAVLTSPGHEGAVYEITGPALYSLHDAAAIASEVTGRPVEYVNLSSEERQAMFDSLGMPRAYVAGSTNADGTGTWGSEEIVSYERAIREGYFSICSHHVKLITGRHARPLREVYLENIDALKVD